MRMAPGDRPWDVHRPILRSSLETAADRAGLGPRRRCFACPAVGALLYAVPALDPTLIAGVSGLLVAAVPLAIFVPAHRATRADRMEKLRHD